MPWQVRRRDVDFFIHDLWKDSRQFTTSRAGEFGKDCFSEEAARLESNVISALARVLPDHSVPIIRRIEGSVLFMERVSGVRLFDLIRHLKSLDAIRDDSKAAEVRRILMGRAGKRLATIQVALKALAERGELGELSPYPLELKVRELVELFVRVLGLRDLSPTWRTELALLTLEWEISQSNLPFRDATTKNMIVRMGNPVDLTTEDLEMDQRQMVNALLDKQDLAFWNDVVLTDVDFSSVINLTSPEDDPISLYFHEWTSGTLALSAEALILDSRLGVADPRRAAVTLMVRYLRFGGRKLAYKLINSQGFSVRFAYDNPLYYFENLRAHCDALDPSLADDFPALFHVFSLIAHSVHGASASDLQITQIDHVRRHLQQVEAEYWQQSPFEGV